MLAALRNLHQGMDSYVQYINESSGRFLIHTSVQQGSVEGPVLFILYLAPLTDIALPHNSAYRRVLGVELLAVDGDITDTKRIKKPKSYRVLDCSYADDTALLTNLHGSMNTAIERFAFVLQKFGMVINDRKTVVMRYNPTSTEQTPITIGNTQLEYVMAFNYLGSKISPGNDMMAEFQQSIGQARSTFFQLKRRLWNQRRVRRCTKTRIFNALVTSTFLYESGSWTRQEVDTTQLETTQYRLARLMLGSRPTDHIRMTSAYEVLYMLPLQVHLAERTLTWAGRMINLPVDR